MFFLAFSNIENFIKQYNILYQHQLKVFKSAVIQSNVTRNRFSVQVGSRYIHYMSLNGHGLQIIYTYIYIYIYILRLKSTVTTSKKENFYFSQATNHKIGVECSNNGLKQQTMAEKDRMMVGEHKLEPKQMRRTQAWYCLPLQDAILRTLWQLDLLPSSRHNRRQDWCSSSFKSCSRRNWNQLEVISFKCWLVSDGFSVTYLMETRGLFKFQICNSFC